jgi:3D (Asp-Asp-Asp) domain-containing protein
MHDDQKLTAGDKVVQKMTRDGMVEENLAEKTSHRVSQRVEDAVLMKKPDPEESPDVSAAAQKRKKRRAQRIRDADAAKNTDSGNTGQEASDSTSDVEEPAGGSRKMLSEESLRRSPLENADPVKNSRKKRKKKRLYEEAGKQKKVRLSFEDEWKTESAGASVAAGAEMASSRFHQEMDQNEDDNASVEAASAEAKTAERAAGQEAVRSRSRRSGLYHTGTRESGRKSRLQFEKAEESDAASMHKRIKGAQKKRLKREYAAGWRASKTEGATGTAGKAAAETAAGKPSLITRLKNKAGKIADKKSGIIAVLLAVAVGIVMIFNMVGTAGSIVSVAGQAVMETTYLSKDEDMLAVEKRYKELEAALQKQIDGIETTYPGYDEYRYQVDEISHNPYQLISYFTTVYGDFTYDQVKDEVEEIFKEQYGIDVTGERVTVTETKQVGVGESLGQVVTSGYCNCPICCGKWSGGPTASGVYPKAEHTIAVDASHPFVPMGTRVIMNGVEYTVEDTGAFDRYGVQFDVYYDNHSAASAHGHQTLEAYLADDNSSKTVEVKTTRTIRRLSTVMSGASLDQILRARMNEEQIKQYELYNATYGNRQDLFDVEMLPIADGMSYEIPPEALSDARFANMIHEAEKYLGYPYVWGGASPSTSFDCSGFVSWVINNCGNGWSVGRQTAEGLRNLCTYVSPEEARPGDLIFFQGTYETNGASHVGIYVGNGMMIHCGNPIQYASIETSYWQQHFYCFGRLP